MRHDRPASEPLASDKGNLDPPPAINSTSPYPRDRAAPQSVPEVPTSNGSSCIPLCPLPQPCRAGSQAADHAPWIRLKSTGPEMPFSAQSEDWGTARTYSIAHVSPEAQILEIKFKSIRPPPLDPCGSSCLKSPQAPGRTLPDRPSTPQSGLGRSPPSSAPSRL